MTDLLRRGRFRIARNLYETMARDARRIFERRILVHRAELDADGQTFTIHATSPDFEPVEQDATTPFYQLGFIAREATGELLLAVTRDDALTAAFEGALPAQAENFTVKPSVPTADKVAALRRELAFRRTVYPRQIAAGKMKPHEADHQIAVFEAILADYGP